MHISNKLSVTVAVPCGIADKQLEFVPLWCCHALGAKCTAAPQGTATSTDNLIRTYIIA
jgi:hypothetical protein